jgi:hypothetical protein
MLRKHLGKVLFLDQDGGEQREHDEGGNRTLLGRNPF